MTTKTNDQKSAPLCDCGCGSTTRGGRYLPGHDAKHKKRLIHDALAGSKRAEAKLEKLGWTKFLEARRGKPATTPEQADQSQPPQSARRRGRPPRASYAAPVEHAVHVLGFDTGSEEVEQ